MITKIMITKSYNCWFDSEIIIGHCDRNNIGIEQCDISSGLMDTCAAGVGLSQLLRVNCPD